MKTVTVDMRLYGAFRKYNDHVRLTVASGTPVAEVKDALCRVLGPQSRDLVLDSAIANDREILPSGFVIDADVSLSILPPVCGG